MAGSFLEEGLLLILVILSVPALVWALQKLTGRPFHNRLFILLLYLAIFLIYFEINEQLFKHESEELWLPKPLVNILAPHNGK